MISLWQLACALTIFDQRWQIHPPNEYWFILDRTQSSSNRGMVWLDYFSMSCYWNFSVIFQLYDDFRGANLCDFLSC